MTPADEERGCQESVNLKDPWLAAFLAWLIPGLGHLYQGRTGKAGLFFVCIMGTFLHGLYLGSDLSPNDGKELGWGRVVYFSWRKGDRRLAYLCQVGIGLPTLPALVQANRVSRGEPPLLGGFMAPPRLLSGQANDPNRDQPTLDTLHKKLHRYFELGTAFTMIAGLLNVLAIYDAWGGPVFSETAKKDDEDQKEDQQEDPSSEGSA